jgi:glutamine amidotransferase
MTTLSMAYIRHATQGLVGLTNTGPFVRELNGRKRVFVHNGNLKNLTQSPLYKIGTFQPVGETDSEQAFCMLLEGVRITESESPELPSLNLRLDAVAAFAEVLRPFGPASFLYADGDALFVHADRRLQPLTGQVTAPALFRLDCSTDQPASLLRDCHLPDDASKQHMVLIASVPLTNEPWKPMPEGTVIAVYRGEVVAHRKI